LNQESYRTLISGQSRGLGAALLWSVLGLAATVYSVIIRMRNFLYERGWLRVHRSNAVVISIGNITVGGTGKTPLVIWLCNLLRQKKIQCAILTRGYKSRRASRRPGAGQTSVTHRAKNEHDTRYAIRNTLIDEPVTLAQSCPETAVIVNPDRVAGAAEAVNRFGASVLIMDDGFQHRRLHRDVDIVTIDATQPFGFGRMLPAGLLREPISALERADAIVITRCDQIAEAELAMLEEKLQQINPNMIVAKSIHAPISVKYSERFVAAAKVGTERHSETVDSCLRRNDSIDQLKGKKIYCFCGMGNPDAFLRTIEGLGCELVGSRIYNDHHRYTNGCLADICRQAASVQADLILTTQKDWTKIALLDTLQKDVPLGYLVIEIRFLAGEDKLRALIQDALAGRICETENSEDR